LGGINSTSGSKVQRMACMISTVAMPARLIIGAIVTAGIYDPLTLAVPKADK